MCLLSPGSPERRISHHSKLNQGGEVGAERLLESSIYRLSCRIALADFWMSFGLKGRASLAQAIGLGREQNNSRGLKGHPPTAIERGPSGRKTLDFPGTQAVGLG